MFNLDVEYSLLKSKYPEFDVAEFENKYLFSGKVILSAEFGDVPLYDEYNIKINISKNFPKEIPTVQVTSNNIPIGYEHVYPNGDLCLGVSCDLVDYLSTNPSLVEFIDKVVLSSLYSISYFKRYRVAAQFGERSHGNKGIREAYLERYDVIDEKHLMLCLGYLTGIIEYRGHHMCFCGSNKKVRDCHGKKIIKDIRSEHYELYKKEAYVLINDFLNKQKKGSD